MITIPQIIKNVDGVYEGDLAYYFKIFMKHARNLNNPYHNFRHIFHVVFLCHDACLFYGSKLSPRQKRNLLIAALYHDFDHPGRTGNDDLNIEIALRGLTKYLDRFDVDAFEDIAKLIRATEFPYTIASDMLTLDARILREADASQALSLVWIQQVIFGLGDEMGVGWRKMLEMQESFLDGLTFSTAWAQEKFPSILIREKIQEAKEMLGLLEQ